MSDTPQGPGWWQASDDKWYPPPRPAMPGEEPPATQPLAGPPPTAAPGAMPGPAAPPFGAPPGAPPASGGYPSAPPTAPVPGPLPLSGQPSNPYGMPPGAPPPGVGDNNRTPLFVVLGILGAAAVVLLFFLLSSGDDDGGDPQNPSDRTTQPPGTDTPDTEPPNTTEPGDDPPPPANDGPVQVVDQGFSNFEGTLGDAAGSFGFILENTGDDILQSVETQVVIYGSGDRVITTKDFSIGTIRPGEQMGFGDELVGEDIQDGIDHLEIQVRDHSDAAADPTEVPDGGFEVTGTETTSDEYNMTTTFHLVSTYTVDEVGYPSAYTVFRNAGGDIVGGAWGSAAFEGVPEADVEVTTYDVIPDVDTTEVFVDPGYVYILP